MRKTFTKTCEQCGKTYEAATRKQKCCSSACTGLSKRVYKICIMCGKEYNPSGSKQRSCSPECGHEATRAAPRTKCKYCGKITPRVGKRDLIYCDDDCKQNEHAARHEAMLVRRAEQEPIRQAERNRKALLIANAREIKRAERDRLKEEYRASRPIYNRACLECGIEFATKKKRKKCCSKVCGDKREYRTKDLRRRARLAENGAIDYGISLTKLMKKDKGTCHICGQRVDEGDCYHRDDGTFMAGNKYPSIDHVKPVALGGTHTWNNVRLAHRYCNSIKNDNLFYESANKQMSMCV